MKMVRTIDCYNNIIIPQIFVVATVISNNKIIAVIAGFAGGIIIFKTGSLMADQKLSNTRLNAAIVLCTVLHIAPHILACRHTPCSGALICWC